MFYQRLDETNICWLVFLTIRKLICLRCQEQSRWLSRGRRFVTTQTIPPFP